MMTMLTERALWILRLVVVVLSAVSAVMSFSFSRGDTTGVVIFGLLSALFLIQVIRPAFGSQSTEHDDRMPPSS